MTRGSTAPRPGRRKGAKLPLFPLAPATEEIWLARLDNIDDRFVNISHSPLVQDRYPVWSADGHYLAWASERRRGDRQIGVWDSQQPDLPARLIGEGDRAAWSPDGAYSLPKSAIRTGSGLAAYQVDNRPVQHALLTPLPAQYMA